MEPYMTSTLVTFSDGSTTLVSYDASGNQAEPVTLTGPEAPVEAPVEAPDESPSESEVSDAQPADETVE